MKQIATVSCIGHYTDKLLYACIHGVPLETYIMLCNITGMNIYTACIDGSKVIHAVINLQTTGPSCPLMTLEFHTPADIYF